jgi:hypothetical protein
VLSATVEGDALLAGREVVVRQFVRDDVMATAETFTLNGTVGGDVRAAGREVVIEGQKGELMAAGQAVRIRTSAQIGGQTWLVGDGIGVGGKIGGQMWVAGRTVTLGGEFEGRSMSGRARCASATTTYSRGAWCFVGPASRR